MVDNDNPLPEASVGSDQPGKWGLIGLDGSVIVPCSADDSWNVVVPGQISRTSGWQAEFSKLEKQFSQQGGILRAFDDKRKVSLVLGFNGGFSLIDSKNNVIARLPNDYQVTDRRFDEDGRIRFSRSGTNLGTGMIDHKGRVVIESKYLLLSVFSDGLAAAQALPNYDRFDPNAKSFIHIGYIDASEKWRIEPQWRVAAPFSDGLAGVVNNETQKWGFINTSGNLVIDYQYDRIDSAMISERGAFVEGRAGVCVDARWGFIDKTGRYIVKPKYREIEAFEGGVARVKM